MSKLADLIRQAFRVESNAIGFTTRKRQRQRTMALVAIASERWPQAAKDASAADAVLLTGGPSENDIKAAIDAAGDRPCGLVAADASVEQARALREAGLDFIAVSTQAPAKALLDEKAGFVFHMAGELTDIELRMIGGLQIDAVYVEGAPEPLTIGRQMALQRIAGLTRRPLLILISTDAAQDDLVALRESGVGLIGIDMRASGAAAALERLRGAIDALPSRRRKREDAEVSLPRASGAVEEEDDEFEE